MPSQAKMQSVTDIRESGLSPPVVSLSQHVVATEKSWWPGAQSIFFPPFSVSYHLLLYLWGLQFVSNVSERNHQPATHFCFSIQCMNLIRIPTCPTQVNLYCLNTVFDLVQAIFLDGQMLIYAGSQVYMTIFSIKLDKSHSIRHMSTGTAANWLFWVRTSFLDPLEDHGVVCMPFSEYLQLLNLTNILEAFKHSCKDVIHVPISLSWSNKFWAVLIYVFSLSWATFMQQCHLQHFAERHQIWLLCLTINTKQ